MTLDTDSENPPALPSLILEVIGSFLPPRSVASCRLVCQQWRTAFAACVESIHVQVHLDAALTDRHIAAAATIFPSATRAVLHLPNWEHLPCNVYDSAGGAAAAAALSVPRAKVNDDRRAVLLQAATAAAAAEAATAAALPQGSAPPTSEPRPQDTGALACAAALRSLRRHLPRLRALRLGDAQRPAPRPGPRAALQRCLPGFPAEGPLGAGPGPGPGTQAPSSGECGAQFRIGCATTAERHSCVLASHWGYPATLLPPEGALAWGPHVRAAGQSATEHDVAVAHRNALDLSPLLAAPSAAAAAAEVTALSSLDLRCAVDLTALAETAAAPSPQTGGGGGGGLAAQLTALTVLQLRDGSGLAALRQLPALASLNLWCADGCSRTDFSYWTSAAPQRIRRGLTPLAAALTGLTALTLRELTAQVEPPPPMPALAGALPLLRSLTLELVYDEPWRELADLAEQLEDDEEVEEDEEEAWDEEEDEDGDEEEEEDQAELLRRLHQQQLDHPGREPHSDLWTWVQDDVMQEALVQLRAALRDSEAVGVRDGQIKRVVGRCWRRLRSAHPLDLFSCFAGDSADRNSDPWVSGSEAAHGAATTAAASPPAAVPTHRSLTHLDVTFLGAGLLPGAWHGICRLGASLTSLALRVGRNPREERLVESLQAQDPGLWPPGSFTIPSLEPLPRLRRLLLDAPLEHDLAASLTARALHPPPPPPPASPPAASPVPTKPSVSSAYIQQPLPSSAFVPPLLESLTLVGMWTAVASTPGAEGSTSGSASVAAAGASSSVASPLPALSPKPSPPPVTVALRSLHLEGDLRHLVPDLAEGALLGARVVELRLAHRPMGHTALNQCDSDGGRSAGSVSSLGLLPLYWTQLPQGLEVLGLQGFQVNVDDSTGGDAGTRAPASSSADRRCLPNLERLKLRHCVAVLDGVYDSPLAEVVVMASWLVADTPGEADTPPLLPAAALTPPWDAPRQLKLLCRQSWAPRLQRLELQLVRPPANTVVAATAAAGEPGGGGAAADELAQPPIAAVCTARLLAVEHLSISWELKAMSPPPPSRQQLAPHQPPPTGRLPAVGLPPGLAAEWVAALPSSAAAGLRSLELCLGDEAQPRSLDVEGCCGPWLVRLRSLRRLRIVLCVSTDRGDAAGGGGGDGSGGNSTAAGEPAGGGGGGGRSGLPPSAVRVASGSSGSSGSPPPPPPPRWHPPVAAARMHAEVAHLAMQCLPCCQCQVVQVRLA